MTIKLCCWANILRLLAVSMVKSVMMSAWVFSRQMWGPTVSASCVQWREKYSGLQQCSICPPNLVSFTQLIFLKVVYTFPMLLNLPYLTPYFFFPAFLFCLFPFYFVFPPYLAPTFSLSVLSLNRKSCPGCSWLFCFALHSTSLPHCWDMSICTLTLIFYLITSSLKHANHVKIVHCGLGYL